jgi:hypothetical protein
MLLHSACQTRTAVCCVNNCSVSHPPPQTTGNIIAAHQPAPLASNCSTLPCLLLTFCCAGTCRQFDASCGSGAGKACCPSSYHTGVNPPLPASISKLPALCGDKLFCNTTSTTDASGNYWPRGTCVANKPDCGTFGKSCCVMTSGVATSTTCGPTWGVGYCVYPGGTVTNDMQDQVCTQCPALSVVAADPSKYFGCKGN